MSIRLENLMINKCKNVDIYNIVIGNGNNIKCDNCGHIQEKIKSD